VAAVNDSIAAATANGNLIDRITKQFRCYLPDKQADSAAHPRIIHARCTVERNNAPYVGRYVTKQIAEIPLEDIRDSHEKGYPTVLVIGPNPFLRRAYDVIKQSYPQAVLKVSQQPTIELLDGYRRLAEDDRSRLGWRIVVHCDPFENADDALLEVLSDEGELADAVPRDYRDRHLMIAELVRALLNGEQLVGDQEARLCDAVGKSIDEIREALHVHAEEGEIGELEEEDEGEPAIGEAAAVERAGEDAPSIICTSLVGAKGLSGGYVYIVGCNDTHFPRDPNAITDEETCCFLVALSRTRKECHLISCNNFSGMWMQPSRFIGWVQQHVDEVLVSAEWFNAT
jgi:superfamily I DNA/RNA helicase